MPTLSALRLLSCALACLSLGGLAGCSHAGSEPHEAGQSLSAADFDASRGQHRLLLVLAASSDDPQMALQRSLLGDARMAFEERDVRVISATGEAQARLREKLSLPPDGFVAALVGKDRTVKLVRTSPVSPEYLCAQIDRMPGRQTELAARFTP